MTQPDRTKQPDIKAIDTFQPVYADKKKLSNDIPLYLIQSGTEDIVKIDLMFRAGNWYQPKPLVAEATNEMLTEGTTKLSSAQIANKLDYYGAFLQTNANNDVAVVTLLTLNKHLSKTLSLLAEIVQEPIFPKDEFQTYIRNKKQHFLLERSKVNSQSRIKFKEALFGPNHPYGKILKLEDHDNVTTEDLKNFHNSYYRPKNCEILVTGQLKTDTVEQIDRYLGKPEWKKNEYPEIPTFEIQPVSQQEIFTPKEEAVQSALRMGKVLFNQHHK
ncbi:MAG: M16 family metallopeptidase, partial [Bacteroidota bacterium]